MTDRFRHRQKIFYLLIGCIIAIAVLLTSVLGVGIASCSYILNNRDKQFATIALDDLKESVLERMGNPSYKEKEGEHSHRYATNKCAGNCHERIWYEARWCLDSAWAIEFNRDGKVIEKYEIKSP